MAGCMFGAIIYYGIICQTKNIHSKDKLKKDQTSEFHAAKLLVGYGIVIPLALWLPFWAIDTLDIQNIGCRLGFVSLPMTISLRCLEAMHGFVTPIETQSLWDYCISVGFILRPRVNNKTGKWVPFSFVRLLCIVKTHYVWMISFAVVYHAVMATDFYPFPTNVEANQVLVSFDVGHLYNTFVQAVMMNMTLSLSLSGVSALASIMTGVEFDDRVTNFPLFLADSPSDFWGRRWNNLIHVDLKRGIYKPVRSYTNNRTVASVSAFVVSGVLHEYVWKVLFFATTAQASEISGVDSCCPTCYCDTWVGKQLVFFGWNGVLIGLEYVVGDQLSVLTGHLPSLLRSHLVVLLSLPVGHLFTADITKAKYFQGLAQALPLIEVTKR